MDKNEAKKLLQKFISEQRSIAYDDLLKKLDQTETTVVTGSSGTEYQIELQVFWDDSKKNHLRVAAGIDDGGLRALLPLTDDFILAPDGTFVGD